MTTSIVSIRGGGPEKRSFLDQDLPNQHHHVQRSYSVSICSIQNKRSHMEDEYFSNTQGDFVSIMDGHGGRAVSRYIRQNLYARYLQMLSLEQARLEDFVHQNQETHSIQTHIKALRTAFETIDSEILRISHWSYQGSTTVAVLLQDFDGVDSLMSQMKNNAASLTSHTNTALIACNVGDSRAVLCRAGKAVTLTIDHKPDHPLERLRIEKMGGHIQLCKIGNSKEPLAKRESFRSKGFIAGTESQIITPFKSTGIYRINGNLALSRAFGDRSERPFICSEVDISYTILNPLMDEFVILASDGLWDVFDSSQDVINFIKYSLESELLKKEPGDASFFASTRRTMAQRVVDEAIRRGSMDNISVALIWFQS